MRIKGRLTAWNDEKGYGFITPSAGGKRVFVFAHDWMSRLHGRWFRLSPERFDSIHYAGMAVYKIGILLFNVAPCAVLWILGCQAG